MQDKKLIALVEQYVCDRNGLHVNIHTMTDALQKKDKEYARIPKAEFRKSLQKIIEGVRRKQNVPPVSRNESPLEIIDLIEDEALNSDEIPQRKRLVNSEFPVDSKRPRVGVDPILSYAANKNLPGAAAIVDSLSEKLRSDYIKRLHPNPFGSLPAQELEVPAPISPVNYAKFVIDRNGDFEENVCDIQGNDLGQTIPVKDAESVNSNGTSNVSPPVDQKILGGRPNNISKNSSARKLGKKNKLNESEEASGFEKQRSYKVLKSGVRFANLGASDDLLSKEDIEKIVTAKHPKGIIITGAKGAGKSTLAEAIVGELELPYISVTGVQLTNSRNGGREDFESLLDVAALNAPCALVIENVLHRYSNEYSRMDDLMLARLQTLFQEVNKENTPIWIIATASKLSSIEEDLLGKGGFEVKISLNLPKEDARLKILQTLLNKSGANLAPDVDLRLLAQNTPAYAPGDLLDLIETSVRKARLRIHREKNPSEPVSGNDQTTEAESWSFKYKNLPLEGEVFVTAADFKASLKAIVPAARNYGHFIESTKVTWDDVGGLDHVRKQLEISFLRPIKYPLLCSHLGLTSRPVGVLLYGPPGCGKTLVAKALANEASVSFMAINGPELFTKYVGESERNVREIFERAEKSAPCIIYFDEIDSLCQRRESTEGGAKANVVNQILTQLDGVQSREQVYVVGSTNRIDCIDEALLRPGRFSKITEIKLPDARQRFEILKALTRSAPRLGDSVNLEEIAMDARCETMSGADLSGLVCAAAELCLEDLSGEMDKFENLIKDGDAFKVSVNADHFEKALEQLSTERTNRLRNRYKL